MLPLWTIHNHLTLTFIRQGLTRFYLNPNPNPTLVRAACYPGRVKGSRGKRSRLSERDVLGVVGNATADNKIIVQGNNDSDYSTRRNNRKYPFQEPHTDSAYYDGVLSSPSRYFARETLDKNEVINVKKKMDNLSKKSGYIDMDVLKHIQVDPDIDLAKEFGLSKNQHRNTDCDGDSDYKNGMEDLNSRIYQNELSPFAVETFDALGLSVPNQILSQMKQRGISKPSQVQNAAIPAVMNNFSVMLQSMCGSGKTYCYLLPLLDKLFYTNDHIMRNKMKKPFSALILVPHVQLAYQLVSEINSLVNTVEEGEDANNLYDIYRGMTNSRVKKLYTKHELNNTSNVNELRPHEIEEGCVILDSLDEDPPSLMAAFDKDAFKEKNKARLRAEANKLDTDLITILSGGVPIESHIKMLNENCGRIVIATPERLKDILVYEKKGLSWNIPWRNLKYLVMDEVDSMYNIVRKHDDVKVRAKKMRHPKPITHIVQHLMNHVISKRSDLQVICASATLSNGLKYHLIDSGLMKKPLIIKDKKLTIPDAITHSAVVCEEEDKFEAVVKLIKEHNIQRAILFVHNEASLFTLADMLRSKDIPSTLLHMASQRCIDKGEPITGAFTQKVVYVTNEMTARGADIADVENVIIMNLPKETNRYIHLAGRTGRFGKTGKVYSIVTDKEGLSLATHANRLGFTLKNLSRYSQ